MKRVNLILVAALMILGSAIYANSVPSIGSGTILYGQFNPAASPTLKPGGSYPIRIDSKGALILSGGGGSGDVAMGGVVTGDSASTVFNSTNANGNTMNNAFTINNNAGNNNGYDLVLSDSFGGETISLCAWFTGDLANCILAPNGSIETFPGDQNNPNDPTKGVEISIWTHDRTSPPGPTGTLTEDIGIQCDSSNYPAGGIDGGDRPQWCSTMLNTLGFKTKALLVPETTALSGIASNALLWDDSTARRLKMNNNNGGALTIPGVFASGSASATDPATPGCTDTDVTISNATTAMHVLITAAGAPTGTGNGNLTWVGIAGTGKITIRLCTLVALTATANTFNYEVFE